MADPVHVLHQAFFKELLALLGPVGFRDAGSEEDWIWLYRERQGMMQVVDVSIERSSRDAFVKCRLWGRCASTSFQTYLEQLDYPSTLTPPLWKDKDRHGGLGHITLDCSRHGELNQLAPWVFLEPTARTSGSTVPSRLFTTESDLVQDLMGSVGGILSWLDEVQSAQGFLRAISAKAMKYPTAVTPEQELLAFATAWSGNTDEIRTQLARFRAVLEERQEANRRSRGRLSRDVLQAQFSVQVLERRLLELGGG